MSLELKVNGLKEMIAMAEKAPDVAIKHVNTAIRGAITVVEVNVKKEAPVGLTKKLHHNWSKIFSPLRGVFTSQMPYAKGIQFGTPPHKVSVEEIGPWAISKGLNPWAVAKSIEKKGTKANPFFQRGLDASTDRVDTIFKGTLDAIIKELTTK